MHETSRKGKLIVRWGRKAMDLGFPDRQAAERKKPWDYFSTVRSQKA
jgi:hypothetical protein